MLRLSTSAVGANLWTVKLGRWLVGELKNLAAHASAQAAQWHRERKVEMQREVEEDAQVTPFPLPSRVLRISINIRICGHVLVVVVVVF